MVPELVLYHVRPTLGINHLLCFVHFSFLSGFFTSFGFIRSIQNLNGGAIYLKKIYIYI